MDTAAQTVWVKGSQIAASDKVGTRVAELRQAAEDHVVNKMTWNLERLIQEAEINLYSARQAKQFGSANGTLEIITRAAGLLDNKGRQAVQVEQVVIHAGGGVEEHQAVEDGYWELPEPLDEDAS